MLSFPANLSSDSYQDIEEYLELFLRKAEGSARNPNIEIITGIDEEAANAAASPNYFFF